MLSLLRRLFVVLLVLVCACSQDSVKNHVLDPAGLLSSSQQQRLESFHQLLYREQDVEFLLAILDRSSADLDRTALELFEQHRLGSRTTGARGLLLVIDPFSQQVRIEVGYDLEGVFPDGYIAGLEYDQMRPFFQQHRIGAGVEALTELLVVRLQEKGEDSAGSVGETEHLSGGAGARISTSGTVPAKGTAAPGTYLPQATPLGTLQVYRQVLQEQCKDPELEIYTAETQGFFSRWLVTDAQQQNELNGLERMLSFAEVKIRDDLAVIRFPVDERHASPYFLRRAAAGWQLDFAALSRLIQFNHRNQWHFRQLQHQYMFAFSDWHFDRNGFPVSGNVN